MDLWHSTQVQSRHLSMYRSKAKMCRRRTKTFNSRSEKLPEEVNVVDQRLTMRQWQTRASIPVWNTSSCGIWCLNLLHIFKAFNYMALEVWLIGFYMNGQGIQNHFRKIWLNCSPQMKIRDLMWFSDLENLLSIGRIFYQLGESYLNLFLLHKVENLWSVRNLWSIFTSLSALEDFLSDLGEGEGGGLLPPNKWPSIHDFQPNMSHVHFVILHFFGIFFNCSMVICNGIKRSSHSDHTLQI